jgi:hypothetical protein
MEEPRRAKRGFRASPPHPTIPFLYATPDAWTFTLQGESTYDTSAHQWQVPVSAIVSKVVKVGPQLMSFGAGLRYRATSPNGLANGWGGRFIVTSLFSK